MRRDCDHFARPISDAARIVRAMLPRHSFQLEELVQIGWEKTLRYLPDDTSTTLVFVAAKHAMMNAHDRWRQRSRARDASGRQVRRGGDAPQVAEWHHWMSQVPPPPIELLIDVKRALEASRAKEIEAWVLTRWEESTFPEAAEALRCDRHTVMRRARRVDDRITPVAGDQVTRRGRVLTHSPKHDERRRRYAELRALGMGSREAARAATTLNKYSIAIRRFGVASPELRPLAKCGSTRAEAT